MPIDFSQYKKIAVVNLNNIGDLVCMIPLLCYCRSQAPQAEITLIISEHNGVLAPFISCINKNIIVPITKKSKYIPLFRVAYKYRGYFDLIICGLEPRKSTNIFIKLLNPKNSVAYVENNWHGRLIKTKVNFDAKLKLAKHEALDLLHVVAPQYSNVPLELRPQLVLNDEFKRNAEEIRAMLQTKLNGLQPILLVSTTNNREHSTIAVEDYAELLNVLYTKCGFSIVISYIGSDIVLAQLLLNKLKMPAMVLASEKFADFLALLYSIDACFVGDGGIMHLAAALNKPQLVLFGKTSPIEWAPLSKDSMYLYHPEHVKYISHDLILSQLEKLLIKNQ